MSQSTELPLKERLTSRKFWLTIAGMAGIVALAVFKDLDVMTAAITVAGMATGYNVANAIAKK